MAALSVTASEVLFVSGTKATGVAAEAITAGQVLYETTAGTIGLADNGVTAKENAIGISLNAAGTGQTVSYAKSGSVVTIGATASPAVGQLYCVGETAGNLLPFAEVLQSYKTSIVAICSSSATLTLRIWNTGVTGILT